MILHEKLSHSRTKKKGAKELNLNILEKHGSTDELLPGCVGERHHRRKRNPRRGTSVGSRKCSHSETVNLFSYEARTNKTESSRARWKVQIMFFRNPRLGLIKEIPISSRDISQSASCGVPGGQQHWWVGSVCQTPILAHHSAQVPLMYQPSDLHSCRAEGGLGGWWTRTCKHKEQGNQRESEADPESWVFTPLLHKARVTSRPDCVSARSNESKSGWFAVHSPKVMNDWGDARGSRPECVSACAWGEMCVFEQLCDGECTQQQEGEKKGKKRVCLFMCSRMVSILCWEWPACLINGLLPEGNNMQTKQEKMEIKISPPHTQTHKHTHNTQHT